MATTIGGVSLDHDPIWTDKYSYPDLMATAYTAIDGSEILFERERGKQYPITLEATTETGWLRGSTIDAIKELSRVRGATYELTLGGDTYLVRFRNEIDGGAIQMNYLVSTTAPSDDTWYVGKVYLMCVG
jgi:hypothetical protein